MNLQLKISALIFLISIKSGTPVRCLAMLKI